MPGRPGRVEKEAVAWTGRRRHDRRQHVPIRRRVAVMGELAAAGNEVDRKLGLEVAVPVTPAMDLTPSDVYGDQDGLAAFNYVGGKVIRTHM